MPEYQIRYRAGGLYELIRDGTLLGAWTVKSQAYDALVLHALLVPLRDEIPTTEGESK